MIEFKEHIHYSPELENAVLGACMLEKDAFARIKNILVVENFYSDFKASVFGSIVKLFESGFPVDMLTVTDYLANEQKIFEFAGTSVPYFLAQITNQIVSAANLEYHAGIIKRLWMERELIKLTNSGIDSSADITTQIIGLQTKIKAITSGHVQKEWFDMNDLMYDLMLHQDELKANPDKIIRTHIKQLDEKNGGLFAGNFVLLGARPSVGKSAAMGQMAVNISKTGKRVGIISLEMNNNEIAGRLSAIDTEFTFSKIYRNLFHDEHEREIFYNRIASRTSQYPIYVSDKTKVNANDIRAKAERLKYREGLDVLFIDYLQLVSADYSGNKNRETAISEISRGCKIMAQELEIPVIALCQLNRQSTHRSGEHRYPQLTDLRESGSLEQDADVVLFLHRDWLAGHLTDSKGETTENQADLIVAKWRNGECGFRLPLKFNGPKMSFEFNESVQEFEFQGYTPIDEQPFSDQ